MSILLDFMQTPLSQIIRDMFKSGEQGFWYDPSDFSTMFQDSAGTTPVTALGQSVGLMLDKRLGLVLGSELINSTWTPSAATISESAGVVSFIGARQTTDYIQNGGTVTSGRWYKATYTISGYSSGGCSFSVGFISQGSLLSSANGTVTQIFMATATGDIQLRARGSTTTLSVSGISVRELPGNHAYQTTALSRPTLQQDSAGRYYLQFDGTDDGMATNSIDFTGTNKMTVWAGVRKLSDAGGRGMILETGPGTTGVNAIRLEGPSAATNLNFAFSSSGSLVVVAPSPTGSYPAPITAVLTGIGAISTDTCILRVNGAQAASNTADQGTGNYGNHVLYIGRRAGTSLPFNGRIYQLIGRGAETPLAQIQAVERYVNSKTGPT